MSEVIRDAIIRLRIETQKSKLEAGEFSTQARQVEQTTRAYKEQAQASREVHQSVKENQKAVRESQQTHVEFGMHTARSFRHGLEGVVQFTRGVALMTASGEEDTRKLLESFAKIEAATALIKGGVNLAKFAGSFGPVGVAVAGVATAVGLGVAAWNRYRNAIEEVKKKMEETRDVLRTIEEQSAKTWAKARGESLALEELRNKYLNRSQDEQYREMRHEVARMFNLSGERIQRGRTDGTDPETRRRTEVVYERQRLDLLKRMMELDSGKYGRDQELIQFKQTAQGMAFGAASLGGLGLGAGTGALALGGQAGATIGTQGYMATLKRLVEAQDAAMNKLIGKYQDTERHIADLERELGTANPR